MATFFQRVRRAIVTELSPPQAPTAAPPAPASPVETTAQPAAHIPLDVASVRVVAPWALVAPAGRPDPAAVARVADAVRRARDDATPVQVHLHLDGAEAPGDWALRETAEHYAATVGALARELGQRGAAPDVWLTLVRPWASIVEGPPAPPYALTSAHVARAHHAVLGHGLAALALRAADPAARVGIVLDQVVHVPTDDERSADLHAVHDADTRRNHLLLGPVQEGALPVDLVAELRGEVDFSPVRPGDLGRARARIDVLGVAVPRVWRLAGAAQGADAAEVTGPAERATALRDLLRAFDVAHEGLPLLVDAAGTAEQCPEHLPAHLLGDVVRGARADEIPVLPVARAVERVGRAPTDGAP